MKKFIKNLGINILFNILGILGFPIIILTSFVSMLYSIMVYGLTPFNVIDQYEVNDQEHEFVDKAYTAYKMIDAWLQNKHKYWAMIYNVYVFDLLLKFKILGYNKEKIYFLKEEY